MSTLFKEMSANQVCAVHGFSHVWCGILFIFDHSQLKDCTNKQKWGPFFRIQNCEQITGKLAPAPPAAL